MKRLVDVVAASAGLVALAPLLAVLAVLVKLSSRGPVFHGSERVGRDGKVFRLYKFRSMRVGEPGPAITRADDPRVTAVGRMLRRTKLDELPQLMNVLRGDASLVGPRPEAPCYVRLYDREQRSILTVRPGLTSPASLLYRDEEAQLVGPDWERVYVEKIMPAKLRVDLAYLERRTLASDLRVIVATMAALVFGRPCGETETIVDQGGRGEIQAHAGMQTSARHGRPSESGESPPGGSLA